MTTSRISPVDILLVEDNPRDLKLALHAFDDSRLANHIHVARDGAEALDFLFGTGAFAERDPAARPKLVLLDLKLPLIDGLEVLRRIRAEPMTRTLPVVVLTSSREEPDMQQAYHLGVNSYIVKPVDLAQFMDVTKRLGFYWLMLNQAPGAGRSPDETDDGSA